MFILLDLSYFHITPFSFRSVCTLKNGGVFFSVYTTSFSDRNRYLSIGIHICPQKRICLTVSFMLALLVAFSNCSVFSVHITKLRFCLAPFSFSSVPIIVFIKFRFWGGLV